MPATDAELGRVIRANQQIVARIRGQVVRYVSTYWRSMDGYRDPDIEKFIRSVVPVVTGGQQQVAAITAAVLASVEQLSTGRPVRPRAVKPATVTTDALRGVDAATVYRRPAITVWTALANGVPFAAAAERGLSRALDIVTTDLQLARTHTAREVLTSSTNVVGYRRVLEGPDSCALCLVASTQRYHVEDLMPIHPGCDCSVAPIFGDRDPGRVINRDLLDETHETIASRFGDAAAGASDIPGQSDPVKYRDVLVSHEHGEIGPVLAVRGQTFTGPDDI